MCTIITQILEVEAKIANSTSEGERQVLQHELERLNAQFEAKKVEEPKLTDRQLNEDYLFIVGHCSLQEIREMSDKELTALVAHLVEESGY